MVVGLLTGLAQAQCEPREPLLLALESEVAQAQWESAQWESVQGSMARVVRAMGCGSAVEPSQLARMWLCEAALARSRSDEASVQDALAAALQLSPSLASSGPETFRTEIAALAGNEPGMGTLSVDPAGAITVLDGELLASGAPPAWPLQTRAGLHLLQAGPSADALEAALVVYLAPNVDLVVTLPVYLPPPVPPPAPKRPLGKKRRDFALLFAGVATGTGGLVTATLAQAQNRVMRQASTHGQLDAAFRTQQALGFTAYGLASASATSTLLLVVLK